MNQSAWRFFPHYLGGVMLVVFAVNGYMMYDAFKTFPGEAGQDGFDLSNEYDRVIAAAKQQATLGWTVDASIGADRTLSLTLAGRTGAPLAGAEIIATAERPVGPPERTALVFRQAVDGRYQTPTTLWSGQWDILMTIKADGHVFGATRRVVVK